MNKLSPVGLQLIKTEEGFRPIKYKDIAGFWTVGYGHLILPTDNFTAPLNEEEATTLLLSDAEHVEVYLNAVQPNLTQNQFDALVDFGFNLGVGPLHQLLAHGLDQIPVQILRWDHSEGKVINGLLLRRQKELALWNANAN